MFLIIDLYGYLPEIGLLCLFSFDLYGYLPEIGLLCLFSLSFSTNEISVKLHFLFS